jgi:uridine kinase
MMKTQNPKEKPADIIVRHIKERLAEHHGVFVIALDGKSGTGKTMLAKQVAERLDVVNVLCDDFFVGGSNKSWANKSIQEKNDSVIDWRRIRQEALEPLKRGKTAKWHPFNWEKFEGLSDETIEARPKQIVILDGAYSSRKELSDLVDFSILVTASEDTRVGRVVGREGKDYSDDWHQTWQDAMDYYFKEVRPPETFDLIVEN